MSAIVTAIGFALLALVHSALGEAKLLRPLFARPWELGLPRGAAERIFRFAWHLTSLAWLGLAALALGASSWLVLMSTALLSGAVILVLLPAHLAWPIFLTTGLAAGLAGGQVGAGTLTAICLAAALGLVLVGGLHVGWAFGRGTGMLAAVLPADASGRPLLRPPWWACLGVGAGLLATAGALVLRVLGSQLPGLAGGLVVMTIVFALRAVGDGRRVGFTKRARGSLFARLDDRVYTPLAVLFAAGGAAALLL